MSEKATPARPARTSTPGTGGTEVYLDLDHNLWRPELPEFMTSEELFELPKEVHRKIELWDGRVVLAPNDPRARGSASLHLCGAIHRRLPAETGRRLLQTCPRLDILFGATGESDFMRPDFLVFRAIPMDENPRATDVLLVGEVLCELSQRFDPQARRNRYAEAGIPWYWEIVLAPQTFEIAEVRAYSLAETSSIRMPAGVSPVRSADYVQVAAWTRADADGITFDQPFPIHIPWAELELEY